MTWCNTSEKNYETSVRHWLSFFFYLRKQQWKVTKKFLRHTRHYVNRPLRHPHSPFVPTALQLCYKTDGDPYNVRWDVSRRLMHGFVTSRDVSCIHFWIWDVSRRLMHTFFWLQHVFDFFYNEFGCKNFSNFFYNEFGCKNFSIFFTMNLAVKIFRIFFTMNLAVKIFRIFFTMNLAVKIFRIFLYSRINFFFFVVKNEKSSHVSQTPYLVSMLFSRPRWSFFKVFPTS